MPDSVKDQTLDQIASQIKTLADAIDTSLVPETTVPIRALDAQDLKNLLVAVCYDDDSIESEQRSTTERDMRGYKAYVYFLLPQRSHRDTRAKNLHSLMQSVRRYYNHRRRMSAVVASSVNEATSRVLDGAPQLSKDVEAVKIVHALTIVAWYLEPRTA